MQASFSALEFAAKKKVTRRERLLGEIRAFIAANDAQLKTKE